MVHYISRSIIIPEVIKLIMQEYGMSQDKALEAFYSSATGASVSEDETGLYGQSPLYIFGLYKNEMNEVHNL